MQRNRTTMMGGGETDGKLLVNGFGVSALQNGGFEMDSFDDDCGTAVSLSFLPLYTQKMVQTYILY